MPTASLHLAFGSLVKLIIYNIKNICNYFILSDSDKFCIALLLTYPVQPAKITAFPAKYILLKQNLYFFTNSLKSSLSAMSLVLDYGGPDGEAGAAMRYLSQRYSMTDRRVMGALTDIGTEELGHLEIVATIIRQLTKNLTPEEIKASGFDKYYIDHTLAIWPQAASGEPFSASQLQSTGDTITDLYEDMAAEQKARLTYDNILRIVKDPEVAEPIRFLREREIVHFQRFGECLRRTQENLDCRNFYAFNQQIDKKNCGK